MSKYDSLRELPNDDITGVIRRRELSSFILDGDHIRIIHGLLPCPDCGSILDIDFKTDKWRCSGCGTEWSSQELLEAIKSGYQTPYLSIRDLEH